MRSDMKIDRPVLLLFAAVTLALLHGRASCADELAAGKLVDKVVCRMDSGQSYALYLPSGYTPSKRWPILYCFDPGARGRVPVELFKAAAEKYGYIVVGSNGSRNGPFELAAAAMRAMWDDTHARFAIDDRRVYAAGFSGGARAACHMGLMLEGRVSGVIAFGGGFPYDVSPSRQTPFVLFGAAGSADFNLVEVRRLAAAFDALAIPNRLAVFEGEHAWPPEETCSEAIEWMEIQATRAGKKERDDALTGEIFARRVERARGYEAAGQVYGAYVSYAALAADFKGLKDVTEFEKKAAALKASEQVRQALRQEKQQDERQELRSREFFALKQMLGQPEERARAFADLKGNISDLKKKAQEEAGSVDRLVARRVLGLFFVQSIEEARALREQREYEMAALNFSIAAEIRPENARVLYGLACAYALGGERKRALRALEKAVEKGFRDLAELESNKDLDGLRGEADYKRLVESLKGKG
jgi:dienelactone hydrolase